MSNVQKAHAQEALSVFAPVPVDSPDIPNARRRLLRQKVCRIAYSPTCSVEHVLYHVCYLETCLGHPNRIGYDAIVLGLTRGASHHRACWTEYPDKNSERFCKVQEIEVNRGDRERCHVLFSAHDCSLMKESH